MRAEKMYPIVEEYLCKDQTQKQFCKETGIALHIFSYWVRKYKLDQNPTEEPKRKKFINLKVAGSPASKNHFNGGSIEINYLNGTIIRLPEDLAWSVLEKVMTKLNNDNLY